MWRLMLILFCLSASLGAVGLRVVSYNVGARFSDGDFIYGIGDPGQPDHDKVLEVLSRIDADVVALQEIHFRDVSGSPDDLDALAASLGLPYVYAGSSSGAIDFNIRVVFLSRYPFLNSEVVRSPGGAKEISRLFPVVRVDVPGTDSDPWIVSTHIKSGTSSADRFRKAVEIQRLAGYFDQEGITDDDPFIIVGDFNPSGLERTFDSADFDSLEPSLPNSYSLGSDISFPVGYSTDIPSYFSAVSPVLLDPRQLNGSDGTFRSGSTLDLLMVSPSIASRPIGTEVYNSAWDESNVTGLPKSGSPLAEAVSLDASDHYAVVADLELDEPDPYYLAQSGSSVIESFDGFEGVRDPVPWSGNVAGWLGQDDGTSLSAGGRSYGSGVERAPGFIASGEALFLEAEFVNQASVPLTILDLSYVAEQWRASMNGSADRIEVDLLEGESVLRVAELDFTARTDLPTGAVSGGVGMGRSARVHGLDIAQDESFKLRFRFMPGAGVGIPPAEVFINEFHYDNNSSDSGEFVEVVVGHGYAGALDDVEVILYNGSNGSEYGDRHALNTFTEGAPVSSGHRIFFKMIEGIQNGGPDGFAITVGGMVSSFVSYEGSFVATEGPAAGMTSIDIGVSQGSSEPAGMNSIGLSGSGGESEGFVWSKFSGVAHSPGVPNAGQSFTIPGLPSQGLAIDDVVVTFVPDSDGDGLADDEDPDDDNDGQSDGDELAFGTDPLDESSFFEISLNSSAGEFELSFPGAEGVLYTVEWGDDLFAWETLSTHLGGGKEVKVSLPSMERRVFFRVRAGE